MSISEEHVRSCNGQWIPSSNLSVATNKRSKSELQFGHTPAPIENVFFGLNLARINSCAYKDDSCIKQHTYSYAFNHVNFITLFEFELFQHFRSLALAFAASMEALYWTKWSIDSATWPWFHHIRFSLHRWQWRQQWQAAAAATAVTTLVAKKPLFVIFMYLNRRLFTYRSSKRALTRPFAWWWCCCHCWYNLTVSTKTTHTHSHRQNCREFTEISIVVLFVCLQTKIYHSEEKTKLDEKRMSERS